jgi:hypothetical protein
MHPAGIAIGAISRLILLAAVAQYFIGLDRTMKNFAAHLGKRVTVK